MAADLGAGGASASRPRSVGRTVVRITFVLLIGIVIAAGLLAVFFPANLVKDWVAGNLTKSMGRPVSMGDAHLTLGAPLAVRIDNVVIGNPQGVTGPEFLKTGPINAEIKLRPLFSKRIEIESLAIEKPEMNLVKAADGSNNWSLEGGTGGDGGFALAFPPATVSKGRLTYARPDAETVSLDDIDATVTGDPATGALSAKGSLSHKQEPLTFDVAVADTRAMAGGNPIGLKGTVDGRHLKADLSGNATSAGTFAGDVTASSPSLAALASWLGAAVADTGTAIPASFKGRIDAKADAIGLEGADVEINGTKGRVDGRVSIAGPRPKLEGTIDSPRIDLSRFSGTAPAIARAAPEAVDDEETIEVEVDPDIEGLMQSLKALETGQAAPRAAAEPTAEDEARAAAERAAKAAWSEAPIDLAFLRHVDLDVTVSADEVGYGRLDIKNVRSKVKLDDGLLESKIEEATIAGGQSTGTIALDSRANPLSANLALAMTAAAAEPIITEFAGKPFLTGTSDVDITATAKGMSQNDLAGSLEGKAKFKMAKGTIRGFDVKQAAENFSILGALFDYFSGKTQKYKFDIKKKTGFENLQAEYVIKRGVLKSTPDLQIGGSEVEIQSRGEVSVVQKLINQDIKVKVVPPPKFPAIPVRITGGWAKPNFKIDWNSVDWGAMSGGGEPIAMLRSATPQEAAILPEVRSAIERALDANEGSGRISDDGKALLRALVGEPEPAATPETPAPSAP